MMNDKACLLKTIIFNLNLFCKSAWSDASTWVHNDYYNKEDNTNGINYYIKPIQWLVLFPIEL